MLSWNSTVDGSYLICSKAFDDAGLISQTICYTVIVGAIIPTIEKSTVSPIGVSYPTSTLVHTFTCDYATNVQKPKVSAYINVYKDNSNLNISDSLVYRIDSALPNSTIYYNNVSMSFDIPFGKLVSGNYYFTFDYGKLKIEMIHSNPKKSRFG